MSYPYINPGDLRQQVIIQTMTITRDTYGQEIETPATFATVWADIQPMLGKERIEGAATTSPVDTKIRIRSLAGVTAKMRVLWGTRTYKIESVVNVRERQREMVLYCREDRD